MTSAPSPWRWQQWQGRPYLTCDLLAAWPHGFFTQHFAPELPDRLHQALHPQGQAFRVKQVHGAKVWPTHALDPLGESLAEGDGVITHQPQTSVWVASADCTPALIADHVTGRVAAIHSGWRGTAQGIVPQGIQQFLDQGSQVQDLRVALGPAISGPVYQVDRQVALEVAKSLLPQGNWPEVITLPGQAIQPDAHPEKARLDVRQVIVQQLQQVGLHPSQIAVAPYCTYQTPEHFFSYRRSQEKKVQWSGILCKAKPESSPSMHDTQAPG